ncbi:MAG TPA: hypothetical protein VFB54_05595 [Burkholderiales bacterium]|nr:hypothetical protein [Burkholderiales bacterium]
MKVSKLAAALIAAGFGLGMHVASAQNAAAGQTGAQDMQRMEQGSNTQSMHNAQQSDQMDSQATANGRNDTQNVEGPEKRLHGQRDGTMEKSDEILGRARAGTDQPPTSAQQQPNIPGQSQTTVGHPREAQTTGEGQGVIESNTSEVKQPDTQVPEQSMRSLGHPREADTTGQGEGVAETPAGSAQGNNSSQGDAAQPSGQQGGQSMSTNPNSNAPNQPR